MVKAIQPVERRRGLTLWKAVFSIVLALGAWAAVIRFARGLGAATNLSDAFPWGLWIGFDVLVGVGLAAGGFVVAATVHVFGLRRYAPITRPAVLTAFLGYLIVIFALLFDLGRPWRIWHPLVMWNPHSVMFEVAWCVMLYTAVLALEFSPLVFERLGWRRPLGWIRAIYVPLVIVGVLLSTLHQSSLGTLYVIVPDKLHALWYTPLLPAFFFLSAVAGGLAMTIFESFMSYRAFGKRLEAELLERLGRAIVVVLLFYTAWRVQDLAARGALGHVLRFAPESVMFWGEMGLGAVLPLVLFALPRVRRDECGLFFAAVLTVLGFIINRLNVAVTGMARASGVSYVPSWMEFAVTISLVAGGFALFALAVKHLPVFPGARPPAAPTPGVRRGPWAPRPALGRGTLLLLWGLLGAGTLLLAASVASERRAAAGSPAGSAVAEGPAAPAVRLPEPYVFPAGESSPGPVTFDHRTHVGPGRASCAPCHATTFRLSEPGALLVGQATYERIHEGDLCASCHDGARAFAVAEGCELCHRGG